MNPYSLKGKTIVITGASSGIGKSCAITCAKQGANLLLIARNEERLKEVVDQIPSSSAVETLQMDITQHDALENQLEEKIDTIGPISGFIHSAGIEKTLPLRKNKVEDFNAMMDVNVAAGFQIAKILSKKKNKAEKSSFVFIASVAGLVGEAGKVMYSATKGALIAGSRSMAVELTRSNIRVNSVSPAMIKTPILENMFESIGEEAVSSITAKHPLGIGDPEDVANACVFLLSDASKWITASNLVVDGGYSAQ